jgi:hypothetical protein
MGYPVSLLPGILTEGSEAAKASAAMSARYQQKTGKFWPRKKKQEGFD